MTKLVCILEDIKKRVAVSSKEKYQLDLLHPEDLNLEELVSAVFEVIGDAHHRESYKFRNMVVLKYRDKENLWELLFWAFDNLKPDKETSGADVNANKEKFIIKTFYVGDNFKVSRYEEEKTTPYFVITKNEKGFLKEDVKKKLKLGSDIEDIKLR